MEHVPATPVGDPPPDFDGQGEPDPDPDEVEGSYLGGALTCRNCSGTGGEPFDDGVTPCEHCDGEGYYWWRT